MDTGIGKGGYSMIGQGNVAQILSTKAEDRREFFEGAAGVSKFKHRKEEAQRKLDSVQKLTDTISRYEQELTKMRKDADSRDRQQKDIRVRAAKAKQEYDQIKAVYDKEYKQDTAKLAEMKKNIEAEAAKQNPELLERYRSIKQHCTPPMARLADGQCCGCFMQLPSATLRTLKEGTLVECDNCGRILYCEEE